MRGHCYDALVGLHHCDKNGPGFAMALARSVGEYGSVIFIAGNIPKMTEIAPLLIVIRLEEFNYDAAAAIGLAMLGLSFAMLLIINALQIWNIRRIGHV